ncbi:Uma2 family endonuclease [Methylocystis echinoides]|uniref:Uma2 family endonuclease n=1 Tax=Methylocystis echinoides TaxID=29468 RepID=UPI00342BD41A
MTTPKQTPPKMTVEEFLAWAEGRTGRYELIGGEIVAQASERAKHWKIKLATHVALLNAVKAKACGCHVVPDGGTVRIDTSTAYEPDGMVYCGPEVHGESMIVENPLIVVEVLSPTTGRNDKSRKLADYFRVPSIVHYLLIDADAPLIIHHQRRSDGDILTHIVREGVVTLDPPGITLSLADIYASG